MPRADIPSEDCTDATAQSTRRGNAADLVREINRTVMLAGPMLLSRLGMLTIVVADTAMISRYATEQGTSGEAIAYLAVAMAVQTAAMVAMFGLLLAVPIMTGRMHGAGRWLDCGAIVQVATANAATVGLVLALVFVSAGGPLLHLLGQDDATVAEGSRVLFAYAFGMPAILAYMAIAYFFESIGRAGLVLVTVLIGNATNLHLNWLFLFGTEDQPLWFLWDAIGLFALERGAASVALATTATRWLMFGVLAVLLLQPSLVQRYGLLSAPHGFWTIQRRFLHFGLPLAVSIGAENLAILSLLSIAGWIGANVLAGLQISFSLINLTQMLAVGIASATAIQVANRTGARDRRGAAMAVYAGAMTALAPALLICAVLLVFPELVVMLYGAPAAVGEIVLDLIPVLAVFPVVYGLAVVLRAALRGFNDVYGSSVPIVLGMWLICIVPAYLLDRSGTALTATGLLALLFAGVLAATLVLLWRCRSLLMPAKVTKPDVAN